MACRPQVLIAEDDPSLAASLEDLVYLLGFTPVGPVSRAEDALALARTEPLCGALLDVTLRGTLILPVAELLARRGIPFAFLASHRGLGFGRFPNVPFLAKPLNFNDVEAVLARFAPSVPATASAPAVA